MTLHRIAAIIPICSRIVAGRKAGCVVAFKGEAAACGVDGRWRNEAKRQLGDTVALIRVAAIARIIPCRRWHTGRESCESVALIRVAATCFVARWQIAGREPC